MMLYCQTGCISVGKYEESSKSVREKALTDWSHKQRDVIYFDNQYYPARTVIYNI